MGVTENNSALKRSKVTSHHSAVDEQSVMGLVIFWTLCLSLLLTLNGGESFYFSNKGNSFRNQGVSLRRTKLTPLQLLTPCERPYGAAAKQIGQIMFCLFFVSNKMDVEDFNGWVQQHVHH